MNSPNGTLFLMAWNRPRQRMTTAKIMPALFEFLYREFCRARLAEMRKPRLIRPDGLEVSPIDRPSGASSGCSGAARASLKARDEIFPKPARTSQ
jgi:hypothetical protein